MLVTSDNFDEVLERLDENRVQTIALDLETTGLYPHAGHRLFSLALYIPGVSAYFDFTQTLDKEKTLAALGVLFKDWEHTWVMHNAKFDLAFLKAEGIELAGDVYCSMTMARVCRNDFMKYSLEACAERIGEEKSDVVKDYVTKHKLYDWVEIPGKKGRKKDMHFEKVPLEIMQPYAEQDALAAFKLWEEQQKIFRTYETANTRTIHDVVRLEQKTTKALLAMETYGIKLDRGYAAQAASFETSNIFASKADFKAATGVDLIDSAKGLTPVFKSLGIPFGETEKGNPSFTDEILSQLGGHHPAIEALRGYRDASKRLGTYFSSFLYYSQWDGRIHGSFNQGGTATGRLSASQPNLQNLTDDEETAPYPVRKCFVADEGSEIFSIDYQAMEYRLMLDYAGEMSVIEEVRAGKDLHLACAEMMGVTRGQAKTINFALLYGAGVGKLAHMLGVEFEEAQELKRLYFSKLPKIQAFIQNCTRAAEARGYVFNWLGRRCYFVDPTFAYKAPNYVIQGGCADIMRKGLVACHELLSHELLSYSGPGGSGAALQLTIHDELVGQMKLGRAKNVLPYLKEAMIKAYTPRHLSMDCAVYVGRDLHNLKEWEPSREKA